MDLRPHETDPKLTIATYKDEDEANMIAGSMPGFLKRLPVYFGLIDGVDISKQDNFTRLDDGEIEMTHRTTRLARFAGRISRGSASRLSYKPASLPSDSKQRQVLSDTVNQYISDRTMALPTYEPPPKKEPTSQELARKEAFEKIEQPFKRTLAASAAGFFYGLPVAGIGRLVEFFSVNPQTHDQVNETVRQIGNDISYTGLGVFALGLTIGSSIIRGRHRSELVFNDAWDEATNRLDPDGQVEASLNIELSQLQDPIQNK